MQREIEVQYTKLFLRKYKKLNPSLRKEVKEAIEKFKKTEHHIKLKVYKLSGRALGKYSFSVNYSYCIIFEYIDDDTTAILLTMGDHDIYDQFLK